MITLPGNSKAIYREFRFQVHEPPRFWEGHRKPFWLQSVYGKTTEGASWVASVKAAAHYGASRNSLAIVSSVQGRRSLGSRRLEGAGSGLYHFGKRYGVRIDLDVVAPGYSICGFAIAAGPAGRHGTSHMTIGTLVL